MATLSIKNFPDDLYKRLQELARREHRSLAQQVIHLLEESGGEPKLHSILELRGLGKQLRKDSYDTLLSKEREDEPRETLKEVKERLGISGD